MARLQGKCWWIESCHPSLLFKRACDRDDSSHVTRPSLLRKWTCDSDDSSDGAGQWRPWADIATPLLDVLLPHVSLVNRVLISSVCRPWHDFLANHPSLRRPRFPWLMFQQVEIPYRIFCSPSDDDFHVLHLANTTHKVCAGASHGWLLFLDRHRGMPEGGELLINPLSKACVDLPTCPVFLDHAALSAAPTEPTCMVLGLSRADLGSWNICSCPVRDKTWQIQRAQFTLKSNIAVMGGKFYLLCQEGLAELDFTRGHPLKWLKLNDNILLDWDVHNKKCFLNDFDYQWLVESNGELLIVTLLWLPHAPEKGGAKHVAYVHRADFANNIWVKVEDLGGWSLFLSKGVCFSQPAVDASEHVEGCIYVSTSYGHWFKESPHLWQKYTVCRKFLDQWSYGNIHHGDNMQWASMYSIWFMPTI